jgi:hypothetical protein
MAGSDVGMRGEGKDCFRGAGVLLGDVIDATEEGRDGKSWDSLSEALDVLRLRGARG